MVMTVEPFGRPGALLVPTGWPVRAFSKTEIGASAALGLACLGNSVMSGFFCWRRCKLLISMEFETLYKYTVLEKLETG
jgi:hypothetical protein